MDPIYREPIQILPPNNPIAVVRILAEVVDYNHRLMNIPAVWKRTMGEKVKVAILDTGLPNHLDLSPRGGKSFVGGGYLEDQNGHGTHVGGIIAAIANNGMGVAGIAPECEDYYGAVLDGSGSGNIDGIIKGIRWAVDEVGAKVINMSLGMPAGFPILKELEAACNYAHAAGVTVVCAAGNEGGLVGQPACYDSVLAVAAINDKKDHASFSNMGPEIDFASGGVDVYSTYLRNGYCKMSGTSMASPALTGAVVLIIADEFKSTGKWLTPSEVTEKLKKIAFDVGAEGFDSIFGHGLPIFVTGEELPPPLPPDPSKPPVEDNPVYVPNKPKRRRTILDQIRDCRLALPLMSKFINTASDARTQGADDSKAIMEGLAAVQDFLSKIESARQGGKS